MCWSWTRKRPISVSRKEMAVFRILTVAWTPWVEGPWRERVFNLWNPHFELERFGQVHEWGTSGTFGQVPCTTRHLGQKQQIYLAPPKRDPTETRVSSTDDISVLVDQWWLRVWLWFVTSWFSCNLSDFSLWTTWFSSQCLQTKTWKRTWRFELQPVLAEEPVLNMQLLRLQYQLQEPLQLNNRPNSCCRWDTNHSYKREANKDFSTSLSSPGG